MSDNALAEPSAAQLVRRIAGGGGRLAASRGIDLKMSGSVPFVDAARIFALAAGVTATNTVERLVQAVAKRGIPATESARIVRRVRVRAAPAPARAASARRDEAMAPASNPNFVPLASCPISIAAS